MKIVYYIEDSKVTMALVGMEFLSGSDLYYRINGELVNSESVYESPKEARESLAKSTAQ